MSIQSITVARPLHSNDITSLARCQSVKAYWSSHVVDGVRTTDPMLACKLATQLSDVASNLACMRCQCANSLAIRHGLYTLMRSVYINCMRIPYKPAIRQNGVLSSPICYHVYGQAIDEMLQLSISWTRRCQLKGHS